MDFICPHCKKVIAKEYLEKYYKQLTINIKEQGVLQLKKEMEAEFDERLRKEVEVQKEKQNKKLNEEITKKMLEIQKQVNEKQIRELQELQANIKLLSEKDRKTQDELNRKNKEVSDLNNQLKEILRKQAAKKKSQEAIGEEGEAQIKSILEANFHTDEVIEIKKGQKGGDLILKVHHQGIFYGAILLEVKNTHSFKNEWINKLRSDLLVNKSTLGLIVTKTLPKEMEKNKISVKHADANIFICSIQDILNVIPLLRVVIIETYKSNIKNKNLDDEKSNLYAIIKSPEFKNRLSKIVAHFNELRSALDKQEQSMTKYFQKQRTNISVLINEFIRVGETVNTVLIPYDKES